MAISTTSASSSRPLGVIRRDPGAVIRASARLLDLSIAIALLLLTAPLFVVVAMAIRATSRGPALFHQERVGLRGRRFHVLKFRTMWAGSDPRRHEWFVRSAVEDGSGSVGRIQKLHDDDRVTPFGRFLRRTSLDELPQLVNVIAGHMRLVGPRPALPYEIELYQPWQLRRLDVKPGMTGLWQVSGRSSLSFTDMIRLDVRYADTWSLRGDLGILLRTIPALARREAA